MAEALLRGFRACRGDGPDLSGILFIRAIARQKIVVQKYGVLLN